MIYYTFTLFNRCRRPLSNNSNVELNNCPGHPVSLYSRQVRFLSFQKETKMSVTFGLVFALLVGVCSAHTSASSFKFQCSGSLYPKVFSVDNHFTVLGCCTKGKSMIFGAGTGSTYCCPSGSSLTTQFNQAWCSPKELFKGRQEAFYTSKATLVKV